MHIVVSWDISGTGETWANINGKLFQVIFPYAPFRPLNTFYVIRLAGEPQRSNIIIGLQRVAQSAIVTTHVVVSPLIYGGAYDGNLPQESWIQLNARSAP